ncbi:hypothetical protein X797_005245 [Metarhizium robertsii]|uniref:Uncharacterized protein n=1 Tax=Metarhizium robertsii TaxID=568076 RepID=A0A0A1UV58_9HYPO|nr:hypothetical protein X797_005245 [Metarhizium robertsii]
MLKSRDHQVRCRVLRTHLKPGRKQTAKDSQVYADALDEIATASSSIQHPASSHSGRCRPVHDMASKVADNSQQTAHPNRRQAGRPIPSTECRKTTTQASKPQLRQASPEL